MVSKRVTTFLWRACGDDPRKAIEAEELGRCALAVGNDALGQTVEAHRAADGEALCNVTAHLDQQIEDVAVLNAFRDDLAPKRMRQPNGRLNHQPIAAIVGNA